eukprot:TRINITY_DN12173_c0_g4_i1.p1 TRINITY_DN12173_c0_g4~~TRINITY_DN12173_c0_g4_i1.p1  ORF type:complete len:370 (+),score=62.49 TRINITY_DN12173_c0_g4_i1:294-1403(+)
MVQLCVQSRERNIIPDVSPLFQALSEPEVVDQVWQIAIDKGIERESWLLELLSCASGTTLEKLKSMQQDLERKGGFIPATVLESLIETCLSTNQQDKAWYYSNLLDSSYQKHCTGLHWKLLKSCYNSKDKNRVESLLERVLRDGVVPDQGDFVQMVSSCSEFYRLYELYRENYSFDLSSMEELIRLACVDQDKKRMDFLYNESRKDELLLTVETYSNLLDTYARIGEWERVEELWKEMHRFGLEPNSRCVLLMMTKYSKEGKKEECEELFHRYKSNDQLFYYHYMCLLCYSPFPPVPTIVSLFNEMDANDITIDSKIFFALFRALVTGRKNDPTVSKRTGLFYSPFHMSAEMKKTLQSRSGHVIVERYT